MKLSKLKINPRNPQTYSEEAIETLSRSIKDFPKMMKLRPIIYDPEKMHVLGGNKRLLALQKLEYKEIPDEWVKSADELTDEEKQRFIVSDNLQIGEWNWDILGEDWDKEELEEWGLDLPDMDFSDSNKEIDINDFKDEMQIVLKYPETEYWKVKEQLSEIADTPEQAIYKLLGNG